ncbi:MAG: ABC transporter permease [Opitutaceae bacterium]|nr:ABC transporter permease [Opitutaceae bacterium]
MRALRDDFVYAIRLLARSPGFTAVAVLSLALGIAANTAIFSVVNAVLLRPLPFRNPEELVDVAEVPPKGGRFAVAPGTFLDWRAQNQVFTDMALMSTRSVTLLGAGEPRLVHSARVSASFFPLLNIAPAVGRTFRPEEDAPGKYGVVVLTHDFWQRQLAGDPKVLGRTLGIDGESYTVVGVMPPGFRLVLPYWGKAELWMPYPFYRDPPTQRVVHRLSAIARLKPGVALAQAQADMDRIARGLAAAYPASNKDWGVKLTPLHTYLVGNVHRQLWVLMGAVGLVLLIACSNIANLLLARATQRQREMAVRAALGANRGRLLRQLCTESLVLATAGGGLGLFLAHGATRALVAFSPTDIPRLDEAGMDLRVLAFTLAAVLVTALLFGLVPAIHGSKPNVNEYLKDGGASPNYRRQRLCSAFVAIEIALAVALLAGAGLLLNSFLRYQALDSGYNAENVITMRISLPRTKYAEPVGAATDKQRDGNFAVDGVKLWKVRPEHGAFVDGVLGRMRTLPQVESAAVVNYLPFGRMSWGLGFAIEGRPRPAAGTNDPGMMAWHRPCTPGYLAAMGIPLLRGRALSERDTETGPPVAVVSEALARKHWPNENPLGQRLLFKDGTLDQERAFEIVGVAGNTRQTIENALSPGMWGRKEEVIYYPYRQQAGSYLDYQIGFRMGLSFVVRTRLDPGPLASALRAAVRELDPDQPIEQVTTLKQLVRDTDRGYRFYVVVLGLFAVFAAALAGIGVYGLMNYAVTQRTREIGVRIALGAAPRDVVRLVLGRGLALTIIGIIAGLGVAIGLTRFISAFLYAVSPVDAATLVAVAIGTTIVALLGCYVPVRRALAVDPIAAVRYE